MGSCATMGTTTRASVSTSLNDFVAKGMPSATAMSPRRTSNPCDFRASYKKGRSTALTKKAGAFGGRCAFTPRIITGNCLSRTSLTPPTGVLRTFSISHRAWRYRNRARDSSPQVQSHQQSHLVPPITAAQRAGRRWCQPLITSPVRPGFQS